METGDLCQIKISSCDQITRTICVMQLPELPKPTTYYSFLQLPCNHKSLEIRAPEYANVVLESLSDTNMEALQRLQNRTFDIMDSSRFKGSWERRSLINVNQVMNFDRSLMTYKIVNNLCPEILQNKFQEKSSSPNYNTRNKRDLHFQRLNLECVKKSYFYTGARAWNSIP